jgi:hypothetical protein
MSKKLLSKLKKPLLITASVGIVTTGSVFYLTKTRPGLVLGTTADVKDYIEEKIPQSKTLIDKIIPENNSEDQSQEPELMETESSQNDQSATDENSFLKESLEMTQQQLETLKEKSNEVKDHLMNLSEEIKEASDGSQIHEKAFEYGQYVYCQQVVEEFETE